MIFSKPTDDRGVRVQPLMPSNIGEGNDQFAESRSRLRERISAGIGTSSALSGTQTLMIVFGGIAITIVAVVARATFGDSAAITAAIVTFVGLFMLYRKASRLNAARQIAATAVAEGFCGGCGYVLQDAEPDAEQMVRCPECGASWLARRITRPFWQGAPGARPDITDARLVGQDHRECFVQLMDARMKHMPPEHDAALGDGFVSELRRRIRREGRTSRWMICLFFGLLALGLSWSILNRWLHRGEHLIDMYGAMLGVVIFASAAVAILYSYEGIPRGHPTAVLLGAGLCGCCGKSLATVPPDADGCRACPHCRASWKLKFPEKCAKCGYSLAGLEQPTCPECGVAWRV